MTSILMIPQKHFPCQEAMLDTVYSRLLPVRGYRVTWLMLSTQVHRPERTTWHGTSVYLFPVPDRGGGSVAEKASWLRMLAFAARLVRRERFDVIQVRNAVTAGWLAWLLARLTPARFVYQFTFPGPEAGLQAAREGRKRLPWLRIPAYRAQIALRTWLLRRADLVLAMSDQMRGELVGSGICPERVMSFPMGTECPPDPEGNQVAQLRKTLGLDHHPVVLYFGTIAPERQLDFLVRVADRVRRKHPSARWLLLGFGPETEVSRLKRLASEIGVADTILFSDSVPRSEVPSYLALATLTVSPVPPVSLFWISSPTKMVESLAMGCPVVATDIPDQAKLARDSGGGLVVPFEEDAFAEAVSCLLSQPETARQMGQKGRDYVRTFRSYKYLTRQIDRRYRMLLVSK